jgi:hypothetical protein
MGAGIAVAVFGVATALYHHHQRLDGCEKELQAAVASGKTLSAFLSDPRPDGPSMSTPRGDASAFREFVSQWTRDTGTLSEVEAKAKRAKHVDVFLFGDMVYVLYFDGNLRLREFVCLSN